MANYRFPTSTTEGENNFVQFDIYKLEPVTTADTTTAETIQTESAMAGTQKTGSSTGGRTGHGTIGSVPGSGQAQTTDSTEKSTVQDTEQKPMGLQQAIAQTAGVTVAVGDLLRQLPNLKNTHDYKKQANQLLHSIKLPLQMSPTETTAGNYSDEAGRDFRTMARVLGGEGVSPEEVMGLAQEELGDKVAAMSKHLNRASGKVINQVQQTFYTGPSKRDYSFNFSLIARNYQDSVELTKIIRRLHFHAAPSKSSEEVYWNYPEIVRFWFLDRKGTPISLFSHMSGAEEGASTTMSLDGGGRRRYASKSCFISNVTAEYGVMGDQLRFLDIENARTGVGNVKITLSLKEAEFFTKEDYGMS